MNTMAGSEIKVQIEFVHMEMKLEKSIIVFLQDSCLLAKMVDPGIFFTVHNVAVLGLEYLGTHRRHGEKGYVLGERKKVLEVFMVFFQTFGWSDSTLVLFNLWGILAFFIFAPLSAYLLSKSLRYSVLGATAVMCIGSTVRCKDRVFQNFRFIMNVQVSPPLVYITERFQCILPPGIHHQ